MLNFAVGPVQLDEKILEIGREQVPYFRTPEFSGMMLENEAMIKRLAGAEEAARAVFLTASGTGAMEAAIANALSERDKALVVNGGSFGQRFAGLCRLYSVPFEEVLLPPGKPLTADLLAPYEAQGFTCFLVNIHETSTGVLYDAGLIHDFCRRNDLFLIVDAISSFLADPFHMENEGADIMIVSSQKALACPPGVSVLLLSSGAQKRINCSQLRCMYFDLRAALKDGERGQTPFTPAAGILRQIHTRLRMIEATGGTAKEIAKSAALAEDFRHKIAELPLEIFSSALSNAVTPLHPLNVSAKDVCLILKEQYGIWVCPNGGTLSDKVFRVGHIGALTPEDNTRLARALTDMQIHGLL